MATLSKQSCCLCDCVVFYWTVCVQTALNNLIGPVKKVNLLEAFAVLQVEHQAVGVQVHFVLGLRHLQVKHTQSEQRDNTGGRSPAGLTEHNGNTVRVSTLS